MRQRRSSSKGRSASSARWLIEHEQDSHVRRARLQGYRARSAFKLEELDDRDRFLRSGMTVVDLGAAPGAWAQVASARVGPQGRVVALDILPMEPLEGMHAVQGDFTEPETVADLRRAIGATQIDVVLSDMAPNFAGIKVVDQARSMYLAELALDFARETLRPGGALVVKIFQGEGSDRFLSEARRSFERARIRKPSASRSRSAELYVVGLGYGV